MSVKATTKPSPQFKVKSFLLSPLTTPKQLATQNSLVLKIGNSSSHEFDDNQQQSIDKEIESITNRSNKATDSFQYNFSVNNDDKNDDPHELLFTPDSLDSCETERSSSTSPASSTSPIETSTEECILENNTSGVTLTSFLNRNDDISTTSSMADTSGQVQYELSESMNGLSHTSSTSSMPLQMTDSILDLNEFLTVEADDILSNDVIMDKIRKINRLQDTINDISTKIKTIDVNKNDCSEQPMDDLSSQINASTDLILNETFCDYNQFFETNVDCEFEAHVGNDNSRHVNIDSDTNDTYDYDDDDDDDYDYDDDDEDLRNLMQYKQAQPISKASNYSFVNKYRYLHPIDEMDETELDADDDCGQSTECNASSFNNSTKYVNNSISRQGKGLERPGIAGFCEFFPVLVSWSPCKPNEKLI
jgi:hypothetical protein